MNLKKSFLKYCKNYQFEINQSQIEVIDDIYNYYNENFKQIFLKKLFRKKFIKPGYYLVGDVGVGKTMILNFFLMN